MAELLLEILSEEIPARMQARAADDLKRLMGDGLKKTGLEFENARTYVTPRRLVYVADGIPESTPDISEERKGPATDAPEQALNGFLGSVGLTLEQCEKREIKGREFYFAVIEKSGSAASDVLPGVISDALNALPWAKSMKWARHDLRWVRPLHGLLCLFGGKPLSMEFGPVSSTDTTVGHRFLSSGSITVSGFDDYKTKLLAAKVMIDAADRRDLIAADAARLAQADGLTLRDDKGLLDEVSGLVEWPVVLLGSIDDQFMDLPPEVLTTSMRSHQKYFSCLDDEGYLANRFIVVANTETKDNGAKVISGNERVLNARLADARFFWDLDQQQTLASRAPALKDRVFHAKLGTLDDKVDRMQALAAEIAGMVDGADKDKVRSAARLAKADLSTGMVGEFPDLQGVMGRYYALHDGESADVADAIAEHYAPQGPGDNCPTKPVSVCVALADKIDTLVGFFGIDEKPTGSKDPFALRRAALGVIRLILENGHRIALSEVFDASAKLYGNESKGLLDFFADRLKVHLKEQGVRHDLIDAVFSLGGEDDLVRLLARVDALSEFLETDDGVNLLAAYKRAANILRIEEKKDSTTYDAQVIASKLELDEENALHDHLQAMSSDITVALAAEDFAGVMAKLASARPLVDAFFDEVTVNADDAAVRVNRLNLLALVRRSVDAIANFSRIEG
jgi:glycyl-tRNA synthetase beta chain